MTTATAPTQAVLTAGDRCDRCGAQAYLRVELQTGGELLFCAHHAREHGDKLREVAATVQDETHKLGDAGRRRGLSTARPHDFQHGPGHARPGPFCVPGDRAGPARRLGRLRP